MSKAKLKVKEEELRSIRKRGFRLDYVTQTKVKEKLNVLTSQKKKIGDNDRKHNSKTRRIQLGGNVT